VRAGKLILTLIAAIAALIGFGATVGGVALVVAHTTQRDADGYYQSPNERLTTAATAIVAPVELRTPDSWAFDNPVGTVRIRAGSPSANELFVGIGPADEVRRWLAGSSYTRVDRMGFGPAPVLTTAVPGTGQPTAPAGQSFWVARAVGSGEQTLIWPSERGDWSIVVMNAAATPGVAADVSVGAATTALLPMGLGLGGLGLFILVGGVLGMLYGVGVSGRHAGAAADGTSPAGTVRPGAYPVRLDARLDPGLSRWLWLVKWFLAIPHLFVLALLWLAVVPLTAVAGIAILFTGRYPRTIFDVNVGVMRWSWRVSYYAFSGLGTDRYPPFSLQPDPSYPADLAIDYPQHLSRGLVLVKWWLLAIPHYLIVALFAGGWASWVDDNRRLGGGAGVIDILVVVAAVVLLVSGSYPRPVYDFVMGMNRWCYRVMAYAALMRDEYPPFRLDPGGADPGWLPTNGPSPTPPPVEREAVGAARG